MDRQGAGDVAQQLLPCDWQDYRLLSATSGKE